MPLIMGYAAKLLNGIRRHLYYRGKKLLIAYPAQIGLHNHKLPLWPRFQCYCLLLLNRTPLYAKDITHATSILVEAWLIEEIKELELTSIADPSLKAELLDLAYLMSTAIPEHQSRSGFVLKYDIYMSSLKIKLNQIRKVRYDDLQRWIIRQNIRGRRVDADRLLRGIELLKQYPFV